MGLLPDEDDWPKRLFGSRIRLVPMSVFGQSRFFADIDQVRGLLDQPSTRGGGRTRPRHVSGPAFVSLAHLLLAKLEFTDWTALDGYQEQARARAVKDSMAAACWAGVQRMDTAVGEDDDDDGAGGVGGQGMVGLQDWRTGQAVEDDGQLELQLLLTEHEKDQLEAQQQQRGMRVLESEMVEVGAKAAEAGKGGQQAVEAAALVVWRCRVILERLPDAGLLLGSLRGAEPPTGSGGQDDEEEDEAHRRLLRVLSALHPQTPENARLWGRNLRAFIRAVVERRAARVTAWLEANLQGVEEVTSRELHDQVGQSKAAGRLDTCRS